MTITEFINSIPVFKKWLAPSATQIGDKFIELAEIIDDLPQPDLSSYQTKSNLSSDLTASTTKYPSTSAVNTGLNTKQNTLVSGTNIKTVGGNSLLGSGDIAFPVSNITASNGLTKTGDNITAGGDYTIPVIVGDYTNDDSGLLLLNKGAGGSGEGSGVASLGLGYPGLTLNYGGISIAKNGSSHSIAFGRIVGDDQQTIGLNVPLYPDLISVRDDVNSKGFEYTGDYSVGRMFPDDNNWIPNAKYVNDKDENSLHKTGNETKLGNLKLQDPSGDTFDALEMRYNNLAVYTDGATTTTSMGPYGLTVIRPGLDSSSTYRADGFKFTNISNGGTITINPSSLIDSTQYQLFLPAKNGTIATLGDIGSGTLTNLTATNNTGQTWTISNPTTTPNLSLVLTSTAVGLGNVNNTSDINKPVSTAQQSALDLKANDSAVVHLTGPEPVSGTKDFQSLTRFRAGVQLFGGSFSALPSSGTYPFVSFNNSIIQLSSASGVGTSILPDYIQYDDGTFIGKVLIPIFTANRNWTWPNNSGTIALIQNSLTADVTNTLSPTVTAVNTGLALKENTANKQNSLTVDGSGVKFPTVDAINAAGFSTSGSTTTAIQTATDAITYKSTALVATTANITLSGTQTIDGIAVVAGNRVLVKNQTTTSQNGVYIAATGAWTRATDVDSSSELTGAVVSVMSGTVGLGTIWINTTTNVTVGTTAVTFVQTFTAGTNITVTGKTISLTTNPSLGAATATTGSVTTSNTTVATTAFAGNRLVLTGSGTGAATTISIAHGITGLATTSYVSAIARNAASAGISYVTIDATNVNVVYTVAPVSGTNNLSYSIEVRA